MTSTEDSQGPIRQFRFRRPPGATEVLLVRHGESEPADPDRPFPLVDGQGDPALAPQGRDQAALVGRRLADEAIDAIYVTSLRRTVETAGPLVGAVGLEPRVEPDLRENHLGEWEGGLFRKHVRDGHPLVARIVAEERWDLIPGSEPAADFSARVVGAVDRIARDHPDQRVAVFTHGGVVGALVHHAVGGGRPLAFVGADNGSITHLVVSADRWHVRRFNDTSHLAGGLDTPEPT